MKTPKELVPHEQDYLPQAWEAYTFAELGWWVHLFAMRSQHRADAAKKQKDLEDAANYLAMMQAKLDALKQGVS